MRIHPIVMFCCAALSVVPLMAGSASDQKVLSVQEQIDQLKVHTVTDTRGAGSAKGLNVKDTAGFFIDADVLYWHPKVGGTAFVYSAANGNAALPLSGSIQEVDFDWDWGFKAGAGYRFSHDAVDVFAEYTYFNEGASSKESAGASSTLVPLKGYSELPAAGLFVFYCLNASSQFKLDFQTINLSLGKQYFVSRFTTFRPYAGLKAAWINMKQTTEYSGGAEDPTDAFAFALGNNMIQVRDRNDFTGLGLLGGVNTKVYFSKHFNLLADLSVAFLYGHFKVKHIEAYSANENRSIVLKGSLGRLVPMGQMKLGLGYDTYINSEKEFLTFFLGYEAQYWLRQNNMMYVTTAEKMTKEVSQDLSLSGVSFEVGLAF